MSCCSGCAAGIGCGMGDLLPRVVWPSDVDREKSRLHPSFMATDLAVQSCVELDTPTRRSWSSFFAEWDAFRQRATPTFGAANEWDLSQQYAKDLAGWREVLGDKCKLVGPNTTPTDTGDVGWVKWVAGAVAVIGIAYTLGPVIRGLGKRA